MKRKTLSNGIIVEQTVEYVLMPDRMDYIAAALIAQYKKDFGTDKVTDCERQLERIDADISRLVDTLAICPASARQRIFDKMELLDTQKADIEIDLAKQAKTPDPYTIEQMQKFMSNVIGTEWEMPVVLAGMYGLRMSEIIGLRMPNIDLEKMQFGVVEQMPFKVPPGTKTITEMAPTKSNDCTLPITKETLPYFLRQFELIERQKELMIAGGGEYYDNKLFIAKPDGSPHRRDRMSANFGQLIRHLEMPHIRFHDLRHSHATLFLRFFRPYRHFSINNRQNQCDTAYILLLANVYDATQSQQQRLLSRTYYKGSVF